MRFKSPRSKSFRVFAVSGVNTISFAIEASEKARKGLLGFAVERVDPVADERYFMTGFKVFRSRVRIPTPNVTVSTWDHPIQSFVWDDFTTKPGQDYEYRFYPIKGTPKKLDRSAEPIAIRVRTEPLFSNGAHDIFFNRGVASSQAYERLFDNLSPSQLRESDPEKAEEATRWLMRDLLDGIQAFIRGARKGDTILGCFYEFRFEPVARELKAALKRGVKVQIIIDGKVNEREDKEGNYHPSFPREANLEMLETVGIPRRNYILRQAKPNNIQHNKFMVLLRGGEPSEVWTGSTNLSESGFCGQTNVGHWVRDPGLAERFKAYWELLKTDPGAAVGLERSEAMKANRAFQTAVAALHDTPTELDGIPHGITPVFSPRAGRSVLDMYARLVDSAKACSCITLAFGIDDGFKEALHDNTDRDHLVFMLLEKRDRPRKGAKTPFVQLSVTNNVYQAWGSYIVDPVSRWVDETNAFRLKLGTHVAYVHSKFLLMDPLGDDPIVVTGSANFSKPSTNDNDENMLLIRGDRRVADIYFTEFNRLFNHYYFRSVFEKSKEDGHAESAEASLFLAETADGWLWKYAPGKLRAKRLQLFTQMKGAETIR